jgi:hypothetical protein
MSGEPKSTLKNPTQKKAPTGPSISYLEQLKKEMYKRRLEFDENLFETMNPYPTDKEIKRLELERYNLQLKDQLDDKLAREQALKNALDPEKAGYYDYSSDEENNTPEKIVRKAARDTALEQFYRKYPRTPIAESYTAPSLHPEPFVPVYTFASLPQEDIEELAAKKLAKKLAKERLDAFSQSDPSDDQENDDQILAKLEEELALAELEKAELEEGHASRAKKGGRKNKKRSKSLSKKSSKILFPFHNSVEKRERRKASRKKTLKNKVSRDVRRQPTKRRTQSNNRLSLSRKKTRRERGS